jgi:hypothetical protein
VRRKIQEVAVRTGREVQGGERQTQEEQRVYEVSMRRDGRRVKVEQRVMGVMVKKERAKSIMAEREGEAREVVGGDGKGYMVFKKTL